MARCLVSFGANIGDAWGTIQQAAARLQEQLCGAVSDRNEAPGETIGEAAFQLSRCYRTPPVGGPSGQPPFVNAVAGLTTNASVWDVWHCIRLIEKEFGRERNLRWEARRIDLDILLYDDARIWTPHFKVPHPRMCMRRFILLPAVDVARDWIDPVSGWTIGQLADNLRSGAGNFVLMAERESKAESLLAEVARRTGAQWRTSDLANASGTLHGDRLLGAKSTEVGAGRWVAMRVGPLANVAGEMSADETKLATKLVIGLAPAIKAADVAWEDYHRELAMAFGVQAGAGAIAANERSGGIDSSKRLDWRGPRYLLASDDWDWAVQELVAALEAMDCPIEVL